MAASVAVLVGAAMLAPNSSGDHHPAAGCSGRPCATPHLPASITLLAGQAHGFIGYRIARDGHIHRMRGSLSQFPRGAEYFPFTRTWFLVRHRHLIVGRGRRPAWRSHLVIASQLQLGLVSLGPHAVAFQHDHKLYVAPLGGGERAVGGSEMPLGWTPAGLYTYRYRDRALVLRSTTGAFLKAIVGRPLGSDDFVMDGRLYFITHGVLESAVGARIQRINSLANLRMPDPWLQPLGRLLELQDNRRLTVLRPDGSVFAWTALPRRGRDTASISSSVTASPDGSAVAFTGAVGESNDPNAVQGGHGTETVYLLRPGAHTALSLHTERVAFRVCERGANLAWHGSWLLYSNSEGNLVAIDTTGAHPAIDLSRVVRRLRGAGTGFSAVWTGQPLWF